MLDEFITFNREEIIKRCRAKVAARSIPPSSEAEINHGVPLFLDQLVAIGAGATLEADARSLTLVVSPVQEELAIEANRQVLAAVIGNLVQNAFKFTRPHSAVTLKVRANADRVLIEVHDECGGLTGEGEGKELRTTRRRSDRIGHWARVQSMGRRS